MSLRVLHVLESLAPGGMETTFLNVLRAAHAADRALEHHVLAFDTGALEARYRAVTRSLTIAQDASTINTCIDAGYDLVHILFERCAYRVLPLVVARRAIPVVYSKGYDMGGMYRLNEGLRWQADEAMLVAADGVTFTTANLAAGYELPSGRQTILRKAADVGRFTTLAPATANTPQRVLCVANLHPRKRLADLVRALRAIHDQGIQAELRFVGGGNTQERDRLTRMSADLGLASVVSFPDIVHDVAREIANARVVALPSSCEGVPTVLLEAMAAARPIVATRVGHVTSIVGDGVEGFLLDVGDVDALTCRLATLLRDPALAASMGEAGRRRAAKHDVVHIAAVWMDALRTAALPNAPVFSPAHGSPPQIAAAQ